MALVEASHYTEEAGLHQHMVQYNAPPPVRLQGGGLGKLALAFVAAIGSGAAMYFAVTASPLDRSVGDVAQVLGQHGDAVVLTMTDAVPGEVPTDVATGISGDSVSSEAGVTESADQLALLAGLEPAIGPRAGSEDVTAPLKASQKRVREPLVVEPRVPAPKLKPQPVQVANGFSSAPETHDKPSQSHAEELAPGADTPGFRSAAATQSADSVTPAVIAPASRMRTSDVVLNAAPWARITARSPNGLLPVVGPAGETSRVHYARPFPPSDTRPRVALVIGGLGLSQKATLAAIEKLPPEVTLAFAPYGKNLQNWINKARSSGHEVLLELPMEPFDYPANDPGPFTLLTNSDTAQTTQRLGWLLAQFNGYVGVTNYLGARFTSTPEALLPVLRTLDERGLLILDDGSSNRSLISALARQINVPHQTAARTIDMRVSRSAIDEALVALEAVSKSKGSAVGVGYAYPVTLERIAAWARSLEKKGLVLAPVSATVQSSQSEKSDPSFDPHANNY